ncbi:MAG: hypothetical protein J6S96_06515 [Muribaculaceae bacterium]|nr:hypothetical protein [Muribaculaceae bacterium]
MKKIVLFLMLLLPVLVHAEMWKEHQQFVSSGIKNNIDAPDCVYMLVNNSLSRFDKASCEIQPLKSSSGMSEDIAVNQIYYNYDKQYLLVVYINSNIDIIKSDRTVVNVPALKNMTLQGCSKTINDVTFGPDRIYISTGFGFFAIDDTNFETKDYHNFGQSFRSLIRLGSGLIAAVGDSLYYSSSTTPNKLADFSAISLLGNRIITSNGQLVNANFAKLYGINDSRFFIYVSCSLDSSYMKRMEINIVDDNVSLSKVQIARYATPGVLNIQHTPSGFIWNIAATNANYYITNALGENYTKITGTRNAIYSCNPAGDGQIWGLGADGLFKNSASSVLYKTNAITIINPYWASYNPNNGKLYLTCTAATPEMRSELREGCMNYDGSTWRSGGYRWTSAVQAKNSNHSGWRPEIDKSKPSTHYVGTWYCGLAKVVNDTVVAIYDERNSPVVPSKNNYYRCVHGYGLDSQGNLWMVESMDQSLHNTAFQNAAMVLPADKQYLNNNTTIDDWKSYYIPGTINITSSTFNSFAIGKEDVKVYTPGNGGSSNNYLLLWRGGLDEEQEIKQYSSATDQYGAIISHGLNPRLAADSTGMIWVGGSGVYYFDPTTAFADDVLRVTRPRTSSGSITLDGVNVTHIEVDYLNRKWISTNGFGVYLLSPDGTEILKHFDNENSIMPSALVYSTCAMGNTGRVMIITSNGVVEYMENAEEEAQSALTALEVYPSLVLPNFTGLLTISGLASGSQVRISDRQGNIMTELTSENNVATWDCCDDNGERVATGTYDIFIAASGEDMPEEPQASVKIIK